MTYKPRRYLVDTLLPFYSINMLGGPSGGGKTRWLFQTLLDHWEKGKPVHGFASHPCPWLYVACDRPVEAAAETLHKLGYDPDRVRTFGAMEEGVLELEGIIRHVLTKCDPKPELIVLDPITMVCGKLNINDYVQVSRWMGTVWRIIKSAGVSIIGLCHQPKMKEDSYYLNPRQRLMGSAAWAACSDTVIMVEPPPGKVTAETEKLRKLVILPRNASGIYMDLQFDSNGRLCEMDAALNDALFDAFLRSHKAGTEFKTEEIIAKMEDAGVSGRTTKRLIAAALDGGYIERVSHGVYKICDLLADLTKRESAK